MYEVTGHYTQTNGYDYNNGDELLNIMHMSHALTDQNENVSWKTFG